LSYTLRGRVEPTDAREPAPVTQRDRLDAGARVPSLDGARGIAILLVLLHHGGQMFSTPRLLHPLVWAGWSGVDLFFVLSGFLITGILLRGKGAPRQLASFWVRRALRIFPLAYASLLACFVLSELGAPGMPPMRGETWAWFAFYAGNIYVMTQGWPPIAAISVTWSLAIEEQFYFVWPLVVRFASRWGVAIVALLLFASGPFFRIALWGDYGGMATVFTLARTDPLAVGALLALLLSIPSARFWVSAISGVLFLPCLALTLALATERLPEPEWLWPYRVSVIAIGFAPLVAAAAAPRPWVEKLLGPRWLRWIGERSYGIYLFHYIVGPMFAAWTREWLDGGMASMAGWLASTFALAALSFRAFEQPILSRRSALERRLGLHRSSSRAAPSS
jgi:peptidoglycan/LPS O-acetylase OafA/YrhL